MSEPTIFFAGDPHGVFDPLIEAVLEHRPDAVVILGNMDLERPLDEVLAPTLEDTKCTGSRATTTVTGTSGTTTCSAPGWPTVTCTVRCSRS